MRVLVTGANGYVGQAVVAALLEAGHEPVAMVSGGAGPLGATGVALGENGVVSRTAAADSSAAEVASEADTAASGAASLVSGASAEVSEAASVTSSASTVDSGPTGATSGTRAVDSGATGVTSGARTEVSGATGSASSASAVDSGAASVTSGARTEVSGATGMASSARAVDSRAVEVRVADLLDPGSLRRAVDGVDAVCHLAGLGRARESLSEPLRYFRVNTGGTVALLAAMADAGVRRMVFASTGSIYGTPERQPMDESCPDDPPHPYASSKLAAEYAIAAQARAAGMSATILRLLNIAGGADPDPTRLIPRALSAAANGTPLTINGDGTAVRDYLHVTDAAKAFTASLAHPPAPGTARRYNIGTGNGSSVLDVAASVERVTGHPVPLTHGPAAPEPQALISDPTRARDELHWAPENSDLDAIVRDCWHHRPRA
ncbi:NAD-dependent epimerase/dehydratase family protein [Nocardia sp. NPDC050406]|uniref:NAD-dependent epimerase/dehydratase family protein n=1 Tax=Nocardia sp. NPDC050406 TaxID=3364318 RepID=UPI0037A3681F